MMFSIFRLSMSSPDKKYNTIAIKPTNTVVPRSGSNIINPNTTEISNKKDVNANGVLSDNFIDKYIIIPNLTNSEG